MLLSRQQPSKERILSFTNFNVQFRLKIRFYQSYFLFIMPYLFNMNILIICKLDYIQIIPNSSLIGIYSQFLILTLKNSFQIIPKVKNSLVNSRIRRYHSLLTLCAYASLAIFLVFASSEFLKVTAVI